MRVYEDTHGRDWSGIPQNVSPWYPSYNSTSVVCAVCGGARGGLRYDPDLDLFYHRERESCAFPGTGST